MYFFFRFTIKTYSSAKCAVCTLLLSNIFENSQNLFSVFHFWLKFILKRLSLFSSLADVFIDFSQFRVSSRCSTGKRKLSTSAIRFVHLSAALLKWHNDKFWLNDSRVNRLAAHCESKRKKRNPIHFIWLCRLNW